MQPFVGGCSHPTRLDAAAFAALEGAGALPAFDAPSPGGHHRHHHYPHGWDDGCAAAMMEGAPVGGDAAHLAARFPSVARWMRFAAAAGPRERGQWPAS